MSGPAGCSGAGQRRRTVWPQSHSPSNRSDPPPGCGGSSRGEPMPPIYPFSGGRLCSIDRADTIADGLTVTRPGDLTFPLIQTFTDQIVQVEEESIREAVRLLWNQEKLVVEPSGAAGLAAVLEGQIQGPRTLLILSGGNLSPDLVPSPDPDSTRI